MSSAWRRQVQNRWVIHWKVFEGLTWKEIVAKDGRQERTLRTVVADYLANVEEGDAVKPLERDPLDIIESMVNELGIMRDTMQTLVANSEDEKTVVAGVREWRRLVKEVRELLQGVGKLPRELGTLRHLVEVRELSERLDGWLDRLEDGQMSPQELRASVAEWAGVKQIEAAEDDGSGEPVDAEVVPEPASGS